MEERQPVQASAKLCPLYTQRAANLPDVTAVYDAAFWPLDEEGAEVGVIRCTLAPGRDAAAAAEEVRAVFAAGAGASLRHLTVHVDEG